MSRELFFSIVVPAHNEEKFIGKTLQHIEALDYPKESYEVIVVENASTDKTFEKAQEFAADSSQSSQDSNRALNIEVFKVAEPGVSRARNFGASKARTDADWIFFLDADTFPEPKFLRALSNFLHAHTNSGYVIGTCELKPLRASFFTSTLYCFSNLGLRLTRVANGSALAVKRSVLESVTFDEQVAVGEDELFARKVREQGGFFFFSTKYLYTSTRRFENGGWRKIPVWVGIWIFAIVVPYHGKLTSAFQRRLKYEVVR